MASRTGANGVDIDGRHQFIDYSLWQASRFDWCSDVDGEPTRIGDSLKHADVITVRLVQDERTDPELDLGVMPTHDVLLVGLRGWTSENSSTWRGTTISVDLRGQEESYQ
jgi:hypothetical protein